jgi:ApbE superfamily uncharacterized protein (UPF0280 family)
VRLWDVETGKEVRSFGLGSGPVATVCFSGDGREIHAASTSIGNARSSGPTDGLQVPENQVLLETDKSYIRQMYQRA